MPLSPKGEHPRVAHTNPLNSIYEQIRRPESRNYTMATPQKQPDLMNLNKGLRVQDEVPSELEYPFRTIE